MIQGKDFRGIGRLTLDAVRKAPPSGESFRVSAMSWPMTPVTHSGADVSPTGSPVKPFRDVSFVTISGSEMLPLDSPENQRVLADSPVRNCRQPCSEDVKEAARLAVDDPDRVPLCQNKERLGNRKRSVT